LGGRVHSRAAPQELDLTGTIQLRRLAVTGREKPDAVIMFTPGLNFVSGPSNVGKTYVLQCIDWVFGAKTPLRRLTEDVGYDTVWLELEIAGAARVTLRRALEGGGIGLIEGQQDEHAPLRVLSPKSDAKDSVSRYLLSLFGADGARVAANARGKTNSLSFRTIAHLLLVSETRIIGEGSPVLHEQVVAQPSSVSAFRYLLSGHDDSALIPVPEEKIVRATRAGKVELLDAQIAALEAELERYGVPADQASPNALEQRLGALTTSVESSSRTIANEWRLRHEQWQGLREVEARLTALRELEKRYELLRQHYNSDLARLEFIAEGDHYFDQLETARCPLCGSPLDDLAAQRLCQHDSSPPAAVTASCNAEAAKIRRQVVDLDGALADIRAEAEIKRTAAESLREEVRARESRIRSELEPAVAATKGELEALLEQRRQADAARLHRERLEGLRAARRQLSEEKHGSGERSPSTTSAFEPAHIQGLCDEVAALLTSWRFPFHAVDFSDRAMDLVIDGKERRANGKGVRALLHAAFTIALLRYARRKGRHPGFAVLDSPLTTYREGGQREAGDEVVGDVQRAFLESLAELSSDEQVIVLENKEPPASILGRINYVSFAGLGGPGRSGFYPAANPS